jgi:excinuclease UvrABC ATPase subunit
MKAGKTADGASVAHEFVRVRGAREHNLKNVDVDIPRDALVVFTGVSGSGKSSLAFGTLYAEAQRRYLGTENAAAGQVEPPDRQGARPDARHLADLHAAFCL